MIAIAKITSKGQTTVPREIRALLKVKPGDSIAWEETANGGVQVRRIEPTDVEYLRALEGTLSEWATAADEEAYRDL
ncbi:MAG: type II toxin-antitoxin system PrlF family antitoxin [Thermodesulfobacteriota bacterium]